MKRTLKEFLKDWVENLDVNPYTINTEEAKEYCGYISEKAKREILEDVTPENVLRTWNELAAEYKLKYSEQWIADVYHCSDLWGEKMTVDDMRAMLTEHMKEKDPEAFSPDPELAEQCTAWWNELCEQYPN